MPISIETIRLTLTVILSCFLLIGLSLTAWKKFLILYQRPGSLKNLLKGFKAKMWMTFGLGIVFFSLYLIVILVGSFYLKEETGQWLFLSAYHSPVYFIYAGHSLRFHRGYSFDPPKINDLVSIDDYYHKQEVLFLYYRPLPTIPRINLLLIHLHGSFVL